MHLDVTGRLCPLNECPISCVCEEQRFSLQQHLMSRSAQRDRQSPQSPQRWTPPSSPTLHSPATARAKSEHNTHTNTHTRWWTPFLTLSCFCRSNELIQRALMDNDFMKHLEHGQVMTPLSSSSVSYVWFKKNKQTHLSAHVCRSSPSWTVCTPPA